MTILVGSFLKTGPTIQKRKGLEISPAEVRDFDARFLSEFGVAYVKVSRQNHDIWKYLTYLNLAFYVKTPYVISYKN